MSTCYRAVLLLLLAVAFLTRCTHAVKESTGYQSLIPAAIPDSIITDPDNPYSPAKQELGRYLFYDTRLSANNTKACSSCHAQEYSFTDSYVRSIGAYGDLHQRNSRPLINLLFNPQLTGADSTMHLPEKQMDNPLLNEHPVEMGVKGNEALIVSRIEGDARYKELFAAAFPREKNPVSLLHIKQAIATFEKTILSLDAPFDRYRRDSMQYPLSESAARGMRLFYSDSLRCSSCHGGIGFDKPVFKEPGGKTDFYFNTGLYNIDGKGAYPAYDRGLMEKTGNLNDMGKYRVPTLRNLVFTAPYFHDGSALTLEDVIKVYENGGRLLESGAFRGDGRTSPNRHPLIKGFILSGAGRKDLIRFLYSLSDSAILINKAYANPFSNE